jgi:hypothetical protein
LRSTKTDEEFMGFYEENTRVAPAPEFERVPDRTVMFKDTVRRMSVDPRPDRADADIMMMAVSRRARCTHKEWVKTERARVAACWDMVDVSSDNTRVRWAK